VGNTTHVEELDGIAFADAHLGRPMPVPAADVTANLYPLISGLALDPINHLLYFNQIDLTTGTNSYIGRLDLATSSKSNTNSVNGANPDSEEPAGRRLMIGSGSQGPMYASRRTRAERSTSRQIRPTTVVSQARRSSGSGPAAA